MFELKPKNNIFILKIKDDSEWLRNVEIKIFFHPGVKCR